MNYTSIVREVQNRLNFHSQPAGLLDGLSIKKSGEFRIDGTSDLPQFTLIDLAINDARGTTTGTLSCFLTTKRKNDWVKLDDIGALGLIDWTELILDAAETRQSDGKVDQFLTVHNSDGSLYLDKQGQEYQLLTDPFTWVVRMAEITDTYFRMQMDMGFSLPQNKRANRRSVPFLPTA